MIGSENTTVPGRLYGMGGGGGADSGMAAEADSIAGGGWSVFDLVPNLGGLTGKGGTTAPATPGPGIGGSIATNLAKSYLGGMADDLLDGSAGDGSLFNYTPPGRTTGRSFSLTPTGQLVAFGAGGLFLWWFFKG